MDNMSNTLQTVMQVQEQYRKVMEPWIKHQEMINQITSSFNQIVNPLGDITGQIQNSLNFRNEWIDTLGLAVEIVKPMHSLFEQHAGLIKSLQSVAKTPELLGLQNQLVSNNLFATTDYIKDITAAGCAVSVHRLYPADRLRKSTWISDRCGADRIFLHTFPKSLQKYPGTKSPVKRSR